MQIDAYFRLLEIVHADAKLYLVFEFLDMDLKRYIEHGNAQANPISLDMVKVCRSMSSASLPPVASMRSVSANLPFAPVIFMHCIANAHVRVHGHVPAQWSLLSSNPIESLPPS